LAAGVVVFDANSSDYGIHVTLNEVNRRSLPAGQTGSERQGRTIQRHPMLTSSGAAIALEMEKNVAVWLDGLGFPERFRADNGNDAHLLYRINLQNDQAATAFIKRCHPILDGLFSDLRVTIDRASFNAGHLWKMYGTIARKGDLTRERPHRHVRVVFVPALKKVVKSGLLKKLVAKLPCAPMEAKGYMNISNLPDWLMEHGIPVKSEKPYAWVRSTPLSSALSHQLTGLGCLRSSL
jgi:hypothetical protein